jgi:hypothetical protein
MEKVFNTESARIPVMFPSNQYAQPQLLKTHYDSLIRSGSEGDNNLLCAAGLTAVSSWDRIPVAAVFVVRLR